MKIVIEKSKLKVGYKLIPLRKKNHIRVIVLNKKLNYKFCTFKILKIRI